MLRRAGTNTRTFLETSSPNVDECVITGRAAYSQPTKGSRSDRSWCTSSSRNPRTPATFSNRLVLKTGRGLGINTSYAHPRLAHLELRADFFDLRGLLFHRRQEAREPCLQLLHFILLFDERLVLFEEFV